MCDFLRIVTFVPRFIPKYVIWVWFWTRIGYSLFWGCSVVVCSRWTIGFSEVLWISLVSNNQARGRVLDADSRPLIEVIVSSRPRWSRHFKMRLPCSFLRLWQDWKKQFGDQTWGRGMTKFVVILISTGVSIFRVSAQGSRMIVIRGQGRIYCATRPIHP